MRSIALPSAFCRMCGLAACENPTAQALQSCLAIPEASPQGLQVFCDARSRQRGELSWLAGGAVLGRNSSLRSSK